MDRKIMALIDAEVKKLPRENQKHQLRQYEAGKQALCQRFPGSAEYEYLCKALTKKYGI